MIELRNVRKVYRSDGEPLPAIEATSLTVRPGRVLGVVGPAGSGKTTLLNLIGLRHPASGGELRLFGRPLAANSNEALRSARRNFGIAYVGSVLISGRNVAENVALPLERAGRIVEAAHKVAPLLAAFGLQHLAGARPAELTADDAAVVLLVQALAGEPRLLLWDNAAFALSDERSKTVLARLAAIASANGIALVLASRNAGLVTAIADDLVVLEAGRVSGYGPTEFVTRRSTDLPRLAA